jgi:maltooligosyltrehalose synthase
MSYTPDFILHLLMFILRNMFKGHLRDDWSCPSAHYEMATLAWVEKDLKGVDRQAKVQECEEWLMKVAKWEGYVLDARIGMKVTTGLDTIKRYRP